MDLLKPHLMTILEVQQLKWPQNRTELGWLSITEMQVWYSTQDMRYMVFLGQDRDFRRFLYWHYTLPVKLLRLYYKIKRIILA